MAHKTAIGETGSPGPSLLQQHGIEHGFDLDRVAQKRLSQQTLAGYSAAKRWFLEFDASGGKYFREGADSPPLRLLKEYTVFLAHKRVGTISDKLSRHTLKHYVENLISALARERAKPLPTAEAKDLAAFVWNDVGDEMGLSTKMNSKGTVLSEDFTFILSILYDHNYLGTFPNMRTVFNLTLFMNMMIDTCGRGAELAHTPKNPKGMHLMWKDVEIYAFKVDNAVELRAVVTIHWQKGQKYDESKFKKVPFSLLPTSLALQDSMRLLLTAAFMDGVFANGLRKWKDIQRLKATTDGVKLRIKHTMRDIPVFRLVNGKHCLTDNPECLDDLQKEIRRLGRRSGFEKRLVAYCFRRGAAFILSTESTVENRMYMMGHSRPDEVKPYLPEVLPIDFAGMYRGVEERNVKPMVAMSLGRSAQAPKRISQEGWKQVMSDPLVLEAKDKLENLKGQLIRRHGSLAAAARTSDSMVQELNGANSRYTSLVGSTQLRIFKKEYANFFELQDCLLEPEDGDSEALPRLMNTPTQNIRLSIDLTDEEIAAGDANMDIQMFGDDFEQDDDCGLSECEDEEQIDISKFSSKEDSQSMRLHGLPTDSIGNERQSINSGKHRHFVGEGAYTAFRKQIENAADDEARLMDVLAEWFNIRHRIDKFFAGEEPFPGTYTCRFCDEDLTNFHKPAEHAHACARTAAMDFASRIWDDQFPFTTACTYQRCGDRENFQKFVQCGEAFDNRREFSEHIRDHLRSMTKNGPRKEKMLTCFFGACAKNPKGGRLRRDGPDFATVDEQQLHVQEVHGFAIGKVVSVEFCEYCQVWLVEPNEKLAHFERHADEAHSLVKKYGYAGLTGPRMLIPKFCIFCFHDQERPAHERYWNFSREGLPMHLVKIHLNNLASNTTRCPAYPEMCTKVSPMSTEALETHLQVVHRITLTSRSKSVRTSSTVASEARSPPVLTAGSDAKFAVKEAPTSIDTVETTKVKSMVHDSKGQPEVEGLPVVDVSEKPGSIVPRKRQQTLGWWVTSVKNSISPPESGNSQQRSPMSEISTNINTTSQPRKKRVVVVIDSDSE